MKVTSVLTDEKNTSFDNKSDLNAMICQILLKQQELIDKLDRDY